jgi:four helix bundle protein
MSRESPGTRYESQVLAQSMPCSTVMKAKNLDDVLVYRKALDAANAVSALLRRPAFRIEYKLQDQLERSSESIASLISEGFGQLTDRHVATYLARARGSARETQTHLIRARDKRCISEAEHAQVDGMYSEICKMLTPWINYLERCGWKHRGGDPGASKDESSPE